MVNQISCFKSVLLLSSFSIDYSTVKNAKLRNFSLNMTTDEASSHESYIQIKSPRLLFELIFKF